MHPIRTQAELEAARALLAPNALEPDWANAFVLVQDGAVNGLFCPCAKLLRDAIVLSIEPMHIGKPGAASLAMIGWVDSKMRSLAEQNHLNGYTFTVLHANKPFQALLERHFPVRWSDGDNERHYFRIFT